MYARDHLGCSPLRTIRLGRYKYIEAPNLNFTIWTPTHPKPAIVTQRIDSWLRA
jgi:hypothetical protein